MKKKLFSLILSACLVGSILTGCGKETENKTVETNKPTQNVLYTPSLDGAKVTLADYTSVDISNITLHQVSSEDVSLEIANLLNYYSQAEYLTEGTVEDGSIVYISFDGYMDDVLNENMSSAGYELTVGSGSMIDGFEEGLIGHNVGDVVELELTFPDDYYNSDYAGKTGKFVVTIQNLVTYNVPEWNNDFVLQNLEYASTAEYEEFLMDDMTKYYEGAYIQNVSDTVVNYLVTNSTVENIPQETIDRYYQQSVDYYKSVADSYGYEFSEFVTSYMGYESEDALYEELKSSAVSDLSYRYVTMQIAIDKGYVLTQEIYDAFVSEMAGYYGMTEEEIQTQFTSGDSQDMIEIYQSALSNYVIEQILLNDYNINVSEFNSSTK